jgi:hypothetical protein
MRVNRDDKLLQEFAADLMALRNRAGKPSYETLQTLTYQFSRWPQKRSTINAKLNGKSEPTEQFVEAIVEACQRYAEQRGVPLTGADADTDRWVLRCAGVRKETAQARRVRAKVAPEPPPDPGFRPVSAWRPEQLGVHPAIKVRGSAPLDNRPPRYVERQHDAELRALLAHLPAQPTMIALVGEAAAGKTRSAYEAVSRCLPDWVLVVPDTPGELSGLLADGLPAGRCVIWLDDAQQYLLDPSAAGALQKLRRQPYGQVLVMATLWPGQWGDAFQVEGKDFRSGHAGARRVLEGAVRVSVPESFDHVDLSRAAAEGRADPRVAEAVRDCGPGGSVTQFLAAGPALANFYDDAHPLAKAILSAAMDARRLRYASLLPAGYLWNAAAGYLTAEQRAEPSPGWFADAAPPAAASRYSGRWPL